VNILMAHVHEAAPAMNSINPALGVSPELEGVVAKAMAKKATERFASMDEFLVALKHVSDASGTRSAEMTLSGEFHGIHTGAFPVSISGEPVSSSHAYTPSGGYPSGPNSASQPSWETPLAPAAPKASNGPKVAAALLFAVAILGGGGYALWDASRAAAPAPEPTVATPVVPAPPVEVEPEVEPEVEAVEAPRTVQVLLRSTPPGAEVIVGEDTYGPTPAEVQWRGEDAEAGREVTFLFRLEGYRDYTVTRSVYDEEMSVNVELVKVEEAVRRPRVRRVTRPSRDTGGASGSQLDGYKNVPY
jgi:hypothetical protein